MSDDSPDTAEKLTFKNPFHSPEDCTKPEGGCLDIGRASPEDFLDTTSKQCAPIDCPPTESFSAQITPFSHQQWWLSFVDPLLAPPRERQTPGGISFLGVAIVRASTEAEAIAETHRLGINPGGQVAIFPVDRTIPEKYLDRLLPSEEALEVQEPPDGNPCNPTSITCERCNEH